LTSPYNPAIPPRVLTIAGSDSGGGAGIQADLKTIAALGCYGMSAITAITAQNTLGVFGIHDIPPETVARQIDAVLEDIGADAVKTGMLSSEAIIEAIAESLSRHPIENLVVDPVMVAKSGDHLLQESAQEALRSRLLPLAILVTPNVPEAEVLSGIGIVNETDLHRAAERIHALGPRYVLMKGGHLEGNEAVDYLFNGETMQRFSAPRIPSRNTHGTGCTFSSAIASYLARGLDVPNAVAHAKKYLTGAIRHGLPLGAGHGPLHHGWRLTENDES
jgi:hydroxymethylpyrimidine/phosphomethylpyrimidine kinase